MIIVRMRRVKRKRKKRRRKKRNSRISKRKRKRKKRRSSTTTRNMPEGGEPLYQEVVHNSCDVFILKISWMRPLNSSCPKDLL